MPTMHLNPVLSEHLMKLHHQKHHRGYTEKSNGAFKAMWNDDHHNEFVNQSIEVILTELNRLPEKYRLVFRQNGGGYINHRLFFAMLRSPTEKEEDNRPDGQLFDAIVTNFQSWNNFRELITSKAMSVFGSGWVWVYRDGQTGQLTINSTANQDNP